jgi:hypothetical protein
VTDEQQQKSDMEFLLKQDAFIRYQWRVIQMSGLLTATTDGSVERTYILLGRRQLGLELLDLAEQGQPIPDVHPGGPLLTLIQALREETTHRPTEKPNARASRPDRYAEARDDADAGDDPDA